MYHKINLYILESDILMTTSNIVKTDPHHTHSVVYRKNLRGCENNLSFFYFYPNLSTK